MMSGLWEPEVVEESRFDMEKAEIRIVAGSLRGRKLQCFVHPGMRPTPQMVREALFSILGNAVPGRVFYDIFSGTGVVGLEAISRGASSAKLIEADARQAKDIQKHAEQFGIAEKIQVIRTDAYRWGDRWQTLNNEPVVLFFSPPFPDLDPLRLPQFLQLVLQLLDRAPDDSVVVIQAEDGFPVDQLPDLEKWDQRKYGRNLLLFYVKEAKAPADSIPDTSHSTPQAG
jgi:16S rRNA (guanine966-N2)-methyltransferase